MQPVHHKTGVGIMTPLQKLSWLTSLMGSWWGKWFLLSVRKGSSGKMLGGPSLSQWFTHRKERIGLWKNVGETCSLSAGGWRLAYSATPSYNSTEFPKTQQQTGAQGAAQGSHRACSIWCHVSCLFQLQGSVLQCIGAEHLLQNWAL